MGFWRWTSSWPVYSYGTLRKSYTLCSCVCGWAREWESLPAFVITMYYCNGLWLFSWVMCVDDNNEQNEMNTNFKLWLSDTQLAHSNRELNTFAHGKKGKTSDTWSQGKNELHHNVIIRISHTKLIYIYIYVASRWKQWFCWKPWIYIDITNNRSFSHCTVAILKTKSWNYMQFWMWIVLFSGSSIEPLRKKILSFFSIYVSYILLELWSKVAFVIEANCSWAVLYLSSVLNLIHFSFERKESFHIFSFSFVVVVVVEWKT